MVTTVPDTSQLLRFASLLASVTGWSFPEYRHADLLRGIERAAGELGFCDASACMEALMQRAIKRHEIETLARYLTVGETYFLREPAVFQALESQVLPELIEARRQAGNLSLRLWSAGCCSGEEAYSLAILLTRLLPDLATWHITILGTDINPQFLQRAQDACYPQWSFRKTPPWLQSGYFQPMPPGRFVLAPCIRRLVQFRYLNLADDTYPSLETYTNAMDLILCRNVLMYFGAEQARQVVAKLRRCLNEEGWLIVGAAETSQTVFAEFATINFPDAVLYRRSPSIKPHGLHGWMLPEVPCEPLSGLAEIVPAHAAATLVEVPPPYELAFDCYRRGDYPRAAAILETAPLDVRTMLLQARICANQGLLEEAVAWCRRALEADKLNLGTHYLMAAILEERGEPELAIEALKRALYLEPRFVLAHFSLGNLARRLGRANTAKHFDNVLSLLRGYAPDEVLPESEGITAGRLAQIVQAGREVR